jgi:hypothetical protein
MAQQTAVEWLHLKLKEWAGLHSGFDTLIKQAKEMEKQQHKYTWHDSTINSHISFEQYYTETYGK